MRRAAKVMEVRRKEIGFIIDDSIYDSFLECSAERVRKLKFGTRRSRAWIALRSGAGDDIAHVNDQPVNDLPYSPFGDEKNSGIDRFNGSWVISAFNDRPMGFCAAQAAAVCF